MAFRVLIIGGRQRVEYAQLRDALDTLLVNRLPNVEILTAGGPGVPALAACYATARRLPLLAIPLDYSRHRGNTIEQRDARLVELADAAVLVGDATEVRDLLARASAKGIRLVAIGTEPQRHEPTEPPPVELPKFRGLPD